MEANNKITKSINKEFADIFIGIECFKGTFSLQVKDGTKPYYASP